MNRFPLVPASFFGMVLGIAGLGNGWHVAERIWGTPEWLGDWVLALAVIVWVVVSVLYSAKWLWARDQALEEFRDPIQCCFVGLAGVATLLIAVAAAPHSIAAGWLLFGLGLILQFGFGVYRTGSLWQGGRDDTSTTPVLYLPLVAGNFVAASALGTLGHPDWGVLFFGGGLFTWLAVESVLLRRLYLHSPIDVPLRPTLGIQLAPPVVAALAWLGLNGGIPDFFSHALFGYSLLQALIVVRLLPWICQQPFGSGYWAFSFGATALPLTAMRMVERGATGPAAALAFPLFVLANVFLLALCIQTLRLLSGGRLLPPAHAAKRASAVGRS